MTLPQGLYDEEELAILERRQRDLDTPHLSVSATPDGEKYRHAVAARITELRLRCDARQAYDPDDPCHPDFHDTYAEAHDSREKIA